MGGGSGDEDAKARIARLGAELDALAQPDDLPGMILSGNAVRRSEYLEAANLKRSEIIAAYREHTEHLEGIVAVALLLGGGLVALQAAALATGFPFALVLVAMCCSTWKGLRASVARQGGAERRRRS